jgi:CRP-like cAMP-binding protein
MDYLIQDDYQQFLEELKKIPHTQKQYAANAEIQLVNQSYFVMTGRIIERLLLVDGEEHSLVAYGPRTMFPPLFSSSMSAQNVLLYRTIQPSTLWRYDNRVLTEYAETHPDFDKQMKQSYLKHMDFYLSDINQLVSSSGMQRLVSFLIYYLNEHKPANNLIPIRQKNIASLVAINPTNMSRNIKKLKNADLVSVSGSGIKVLDPNRLKTYLF